MAKIIVERPRRGHADGHMISRNARRGVRQRLRAGDEDVDARASVRGHLRAGKGPDQEKTLNENLRPLVRFLAANVGRPWTKVHSEMSAHIRLSSAVQRHILEHVRDMVVTNVRMIDGMPHEPARWGEKKDWKPLHAWRRGWSVYVNPNTGLLCEVPDRLQIERWQKRRARKAPKSVAHASDPLIQYHKLDGRWFEVFLRRARPAEVEVKRFGSWREWSATGSRHARSDWRDEPCNVFPIDTLRRGSPWHIYGRMFGEGLFPVRKRPLTKGESSRIELDARRAPRD